MNTYRIPGSIVRLLDCLNELDADRLLMAIHLTEKMVAIIWQLL